MRHKKCNSCDGAIRRLRASTRGVPLYEIFTVISRSLFLLSEALLQGGREVPEEEESSVAL